MTTATIRWALPDVSQSQRALQATKVEVSADDGANYSALPAVAAADTQEAVISDISAGDWLVRLIVIDMSDAESSGVVHPFAIPFDPPGEVSNVQVTLN